MRTTRFRTAAALAAVALLVAACGGDDEPAAEDTSAAEETTEETEEMTSESEEMTSESEEMTSESEEMASESEEAGGGDLGLITEGTLTVCSDIPYAPFEFEGDDGEFTGFDIELVRAVADELGVETEILVTGFDAIQSGAALDAGTCDLAASAMTITEEREENLNFTDPYFDADQSLLAGADSGITGLDELAGESLGVQSETTGAAYAEENAPEDTEIVEFDGADTLFAGLQSGNVAAILQDFPVNLEFANSNDAYEVVAEFPTGEQYGFAVADEGSEELLTQVNEALAAVRESSTYDEIFQTYFPGAEPGGSGEDGGTSSEDGGTSEEDAGDSEGGEDG